MMKRNALSTLTLAALVAASLSTAAFAANGPMDGAMGPMPVLNFDAIDADKDGKITADELAAFKATRLAAADTDKDGKISVAEMQAMQDAMMAERKALRAQSMLDRMDANADGSVTVEEMAAGGPDGGMFIDRADTDGDGAVSKAEADALKAEMGERMAEGGHGRGHGKHGGHGGHGGGFMGWFGGEE